MPVPHAARQRLCDYIKRAEYTTLFDFPTKGILQVIVTSCGCRALAARWPGACCCRCRCHCRRRFCCRTLHVSQLTARDLCCPCTLLSTLSTPDLPSVGYRSMQEAVKHTQYDRLKDGQGKAPGLLGWWPEKACTFVDNHDTGSSQQVGKLCGVRSESAEWLAGLEGWPGRRRTGRSPAESMSC